MEGSAAPGERYEINGVHVYAKAAEPSEFYYIPNIPTPELDPQGRPTLMLVRTAQGAILQFGVRFALTSGEESALLAALSKQAPQRGALRLQPAPISVDAVAVSLANAAGQMVELTSRTSSGYPPYNTVFSLTLTDEQGAQAISAVNGRRGLLSVAYRISLPAEVAGTINGAPANLVRSTDLAAWFPGGSGASHLMLGASKITG
jgi:hypothetical protein